MVENIRKIEVINLKNKNWLVGIFDGSEFRTFNVDNRRFGYDFIDQNFKYHKDYNGYVSDGFLIKVEDYKVTTIRVLDKKTKPWRLNESFKNVSRYTKRFGTKDRQYYRPYIELA